MGNYHPTEIPHNDEGNITSIVKLQQNTKMYTLFLYA